MDVFNTVLILNLAIFAVFLGFHGSEGCTSEEFECQSDGKCISDRLKCNNVVDCPDKSDERNCDDECNLDLTRTMYDFQFTATSFSERYPPKYGRKQNQEFGWCAQENDSDPYLQIDFLNTVQIVYIEVFDWVEEGNLQRGAEDISLLYWERTPADGGNIRPQLAVW